MVIQGASAHANFVKNRILKIIIFFKSECSILIVTTVGPKTFLGWKEQVSLKLLFCAK